MFLNFRPETQGHREVEKEILGDVKAGTTGLTLRWWAVTENVGTLVLAVKSHFLKGNLGFKGYKAVAQGKVYAV